MFRFDAAPFDRPAPDVSLLGTNTPDVARHARTREESGVGHAYLG